MKKNEPVSHIASSALVTVQVGQKLSEVRKLLQANPIHHIPVVNGQKLVGLLSTVDLSTLSLLGFGADERSDDAVLDSQFLIEKVMSKNLMTVKPTSSIRQVAEILATGDFHAVPVVDHEGNLKGIVTSTDLIRYLLNSTNFKSKSI